MVLAVDRRNDDEDEFIPERRIKMAERLIKVETELKHLTDSVQRLVTLLDESLSDGNRLNETVLNLINTVHNQSDRIGRAEREIVEIRKNVADNERSINDHSKIIDRAASVLKTIEWSLKIGGPATVGGILYWIFTGDVPGAN